MIYFLILSAFASFIALWAAHCWHRRCVEAIVEMRIYRNAADLWMDDANGFRIERDQARHNFAIAYITIRRTGPRLVNIKRSERAAKKLNSPAK